MSLRLLVCLALLAMSVAVPSTGRSREEVEEFARFLEASSNGVPLVQLQEAMQPGSKFNADEWSGKFEGDMLLHDFQKAALLDQYASGSQTGRNGVFIPSFHWPNNELIYVINESHFTAAQVAAIRRGIEDLESVSCIKFIPRTTESDYVEVTGLSGGCFAHVGFMAGRGIHIMNLQPSNPGSGCMTHGTIVHEFLHNLAFLHTQSTYNRDDYVTIHFENIIAGTEHNFNIAGPDVVSNLGTNYDFSSCLHYSEWAFSSNGLRTITPHQPYSGVIGQRIGLSVGDITRLNRLYGCPE